MSITLLHSGEEKLHVSFCIPGEKQKSRYGNIKDVIESLRKSENMQLEKRM